MFTIDNDLFDAAAAAAEKLWKHTRLKLHTARVFFKILLRPKFSGISGR